MAVDLSGPLRGEFARTKEAYERAVLSGDARVASKQATKCARLLQLLGNNVPHDSKLYMEKAKTWEERAKDIDEGHLVEPDHTHTEESRKPSGLEFGEYVESLVSTSEVTWEDIGGLEEAKALLQETVVISAMRKPEAIKPWRGVLLYGPPGTGKTLLASAAAGSLKATFFNVSADSVLSKYYGESSRLIAALYEVALQKAPSIVFIDEFDALALSRGKDLDEATRQTLSTLLSQLDGFKNKKSNRLVLTLAATNSPWDIDNAALSRFPRRVYVPLPNANAAGEIIQANTKGLDVSGVDIADVALGCHGRMFSGRDIANLSQQAIWNMIRSENKDMPHLSTLSVQELATKALNTRPLTRSDFEAAFEKIKVSLSPQDLAKYAKWSEGFGA
jgi:katanin p60 ATPase-containing subunit A1